MSFFFFKLKSKIFEKKSNIFNSRLFVEKDLKFNRSVFYGGEIVLIRKKRKKKGQEKKMSFWRLKKSPIFLK